MSIRVLFFGATADLVGDREIKVESAGLTSAELLQKLATEHPKLEPHKLLLAVNQEYASSETRIRDGDEVAVFTAVSGG
jgi:molybdopterin converting factor small subunit